MRAHPPHTHMQQMNKQEKEGSLVSNPNPWPPAGSRECPFSSATFRSSTTLLNCGGGCMTANTSSESNKSKPMIVAFNCLLHFASQQNVYSRLMCPDVQRGRSKPKYLNCTWSWLISCQKAMFKWLCWWQANGGQRFELEREALDGRQ